MNGAIQVGRLLRAGTTGFVIGCGLNQLESPQFGALVKAFPTENYEIFGLIHDIHIDDDGLVRQLVSAAVIEESVINDNRINRNVPLEISVLAVGFRQNGRISHMLPPRPALSLSEIYLCEAAELHEFTSTRHDAPEAKPAGHFGYFRHVLRAEELPQAELLAAHIRMAQQAHTAFGNSDWINQATQELIVLLRDDYTLLMNVLNAIGEVYREELVQ